MIILGSPVRRPAKTEWGCWRIGESTPISLSLMGEGRHNIFSRITGRETQIIPAARTLFAKEGLGVLHG